MDKTVICLVGISGAGKTTWANNYINTSQETILLLSGDMIIKELFGDSIIQGSRKQVFNYMFDKYVIALKDTFTDTIILDFTSVTWELRKRYLELAQLIVPMFNHYLRYRLVVYPPNLIKSLYQNSNRDRVVPEEIIHDQCCRFEYPTFYELEHCIVEFI